MSEPVELNLTYDEDRDQWLVWYPHPMGGMEVLGTFDSEAEAQEFWDDQMDGADWDA